MGAIDLRIESWKRRLLDLGKRNRLLNYKETKRSNIKITSPEIEKLYKLLVIDEKSLSFPMPVDAEGDDYDDETYDYVQSGDIETDRTPPEQQKTLRSLREKAKLAIEEQGVNILYLVFGFIQWKESEESDIWLKSPIVLVPVSITNENISSPFVLSLHEDEIVVNPTLIHLFDKEFGIQIPSFEGYEDDIVKYLMNIKSLIHRKKFEVIYDTGLSMLSFLKINMYRDLENNIELLSQNAVIQAISGDQSSLTQAPQEYNNFDHDKHIKPIDTFQVVDADSSQQDAILFAKKGISFVLQGPPGTGKSQTITNVIAERLAEGKKILFVSEKMAALQVVHKRLTQSGLADFCLTLHSHKANKKEILADLGKTLQTNKIKVKQEALSKLDLLLNERELLNQYDKQLHTICEPLGISIYQANGELAKLFENPDVIFPISDVDKSTQEQLNKYKYLLNDFIKTIGKMSDDYTANAWRGCCVSAVTHELRHDIETNLRGLIPQIKALADQLVKVRNHLEWEMEISFEELYKLIATMEIMAVSPIVPISWILKDDICELLSKANEYRDLQQEYDQIKEDLSNRHRNEYFSIDAKNLNTEFSHNINRIQSLIKESNYESNQVLISATSSMINDLKEAFNTLNQLDNAGKEAAELLGIEMPKNQDQTTELKQLLDFIFCNPKPSEYWFEKDKLAIAKSIANKAREVFNTLNIQNQRIISRYNREIFDIDYSGMLLRFKTEYTSFFKIFKKMYREDKKTIRALSNDIVKKLEDTTVVSVLNDLKAIDEQKMWISENNDKLAILLGTHYMHDMTNWESVDKAFAAFDRIIENFDNKEIPQKTKELLLSGLSNSSDLRNLLNQITVCIDKEAYVHTDRLLALSQNSKEILYIEIANKCNESIILLQTLEKQYKIMHQYVIKEYNYTQIQDDMKKLEKMQLITAQITDCEVLLQSLYQSYFVGMKTDWNKVIEGLIWANDFKQISKDNALPSNLIVKVCTDKSLIEFIGHTVIELKQKEKVLSYTWEWFLTLFNKEEILTSVDLFMLIERMEKGLENLSSLEEWIDFRTSREKCIEAGIGEYINIVEGMHIHTGTIIPAFMKRFYRLWLDVFLPKYPAVAEFRKRVQETRIQDFSSLDREQLEIARHRVRAQLISRLPDTNRFLTADDEVSILRRELNKQRKIMPLRKLFKVIPNLLMTLKPCLMMSPLSVSLFLDANSYSFDTIIFDEASQVCTEDAVGAILRGKQIIIAGDSKQLPPTSFFSAAVSEGDFDNMDDEEQYEDEGAYDSILEEASTALPGRTLSWHYRSRHEHLIAFSNTKIYNNSLITFPSNIDRVPNNGVEYIYVADGIYEGSGKNCNMREAQKIVGLIKDHIQKFPQRSLGVIAFSEKQQQAIETVVRQFRYQNQKYEYFFNEEKEEAFFIKNLENVQGDERDTIIFSIGYAKDNNGKMFMRFGPLSNQGGYRRLNVAITRAKYNVKLVGSIIPTDIDLERTSSEGVKMLRSYIEFAIRGKEVLEQENILSECISVESPFEEAVYEFLVSKGYQVATQVGCSGYRIDMAIKHPTLSGQFVLGVECDGATYHSARTARERDRLRQDVLENIGWKIYRIWSTDWIKDQKSESVKLVEAIENAISKFVDVTAPVVYDINGNISDDFGDEIQTNNISNYIAIERTEKTENEYGIENTNPYGFEYYQEANPHRAEYHNNINIRFANAIRHVVESEYPIHFELLCKRLAPMLGNQKATVKVRDSVNYIVNKHLKNDVVVGDSFYWPQNCAVARVRIPNNGNGIRSIQHICIEELAEAMHTIASKSYGITHDSLLLATARALGFNRASENIVQALKMACNYLLDNNKVINSNGKIIINERA